MSVLVPDCSPTSASPGCSVPVQVELLADTAGLAGGTTVGSAASRAAACRAALNSRAVEKRWDGDLARARATTASIAAGNLALKVEGAAAVWPTICWMMRKSVSPSNGRVPVSN